MSVCARQNRVPFKFDGPDAEKLLRDVLTGYVSAEAGPAHWWALLSPQGKILSEGLLGWQDGAFWLDVSQTVAQSFFKRMRMYKLRADVELANMSATHAVGWSDHAPENETCLIHQDPRAGGLGVRLISEQKATGSWIADRKMFAVQRINAGILELGADYEADSLFPHDVAMDMQDGIDFKKGCYVGQEVVSRMRHRGTARRRPVIVSDVTEGPDQTVFVGEKTVGTIGQIMDGKAIGVLRLDRLAGSPQVTVNGRPVTLAVPPWASYDFGDSGKT